MFSKNSKNVMKNKKLLESIFLLSGTAIGSGMLSLPISMAKYGDLLLIIAIILLFVWVTYFSSVIRCDLNIYSDKRFSLQDVGEYFSGNIARQVGSISFKLLSYSLLSAYLCGASSLFSVFLQKFGITAWNQNLVIALFAALILIMLTLPVGHIVKANKVLFISMLTVLFTVMITMLMKSDFGEYRGHIMDIFRPNLFLEIQDIPSLLFILAFSVLAFPIVFTSFGHHVVLHSVTNLLDNDKKLIKRACFFGSAIPAVVYIAWTSCTVLVLLLGYEDGGFSKVLFKGKATLEDLVVALTDAVNYSNLGTIIWVVSALALLTSAIGVAIAIFDEWKLFFEKRGHKSKITNALITVLPAACIAAIVPNAFMNVLKVAGMILSVLAIFLPCFLYVKMAKMKNITITKPRIVGIFTIVMIGVLICISGIVELIFQIS